jgi:DNA-binding transcriptional MerR regulator
MMIGEVSKLTHTKVSTIRFYEQIGLLVSAPRTDSGRRTFSSRDLRRLSFIRHARSLGFSIEDIRTLLEINDRPEEPCADVHRIAEEQRTAIEEKIKSLTKLRGELRRIEAACAGGVSMDCRVIEALADRSLCENAHLI